MPGALDRAAQAIATWRADPVRFVRDNFGVEPDEWQVEALRFAGGQEKEKRLSMQACVGPGKTAVLAWIGWYRLSCFAEEGEHPKGAAVAITRDNLATNLWPEFAKWQERSPFLKAAFEHQAESIVARDHPKTWRLDAKGWSQKANKEELGKTLSGLHSRFPFALLDESATIPLPVMDAAEQALSTCRDGLIAQAGNCTSTKGALFAAQSASYRDLWHIIPITGDPDDPKRSPRVSIEWAARHIAKRGRDNPWVMAHILGRFPPGGINQLLTEEEVQIATQRAPREDEFDWAAKVLGVDVAFEGMDSTVIFPRQHSIAFEPIVLHGCDGIQGASIIGRKWSEWGADACFIDNTGGYGSSWADHLQALNFGPIRINFASKEDDPAFYRKRSEMWWNMAQWVKACGAIPDIPELRADLLSATYSEHTASGKLLVCPKDEMKEQLEGRSPDWGDALALTFASPVSPKPSMDRFHEQFMRRPTRAKSSRKDFRSL